MPSAAAQRYVCRALFLLLCIGPTLAIAGYTTARLLPGWQQQQLAAASRQLGVRIDCARVTTPRPGKLLLKEVSLAEAESGSLLGNIDSLTITRDGSQQFIGLSRLTVEATATDSFSHTLGELLRSDWLGETHLICQELVVGKGESASSWQQVRGHLSAASDAGRELRLWTACEPGNATGTRLSVVRNRQVTPPATRIELQTGSQALPLPLISSLLPGTAESGTFTGSMTHTSTNGPSQTDAYGSLQGTLRDLSLEQLLPTETGGVKLDGPAAIEIDNLAWQGEQLRSVAASVTAGRGTASRTWVYALSNMLQCPPTETLIAEWESSGDRAIAFDQFSASISLDASGLTLRGNDKGCLLSRGENPLLKQPGAERLPLAALLHFVAPAGKQLRPTGTRAEALARRLPFSVGY